MRTTTHQVAARERSVDCMAGRQRTRRPERSRLLGFGPWGYTLVGVFIAVLLWGLLSPDPQHQFISLVDRLFGIKATVWVVVWPMVSNYLALQYFPFHLGFASVLSLAVFVSSRRMTIFGHVAIFLVGLLCVRLWFWSISFYQSNLINEFPFLFIEILNPIDHKAAVGAMITNIAAGVVLGVLCRSWVVSLATASLGLFAVFDPHLVPGYLFILQFPPLGTSFDVSTNLALAYAWYAGILFFWAWRVRSKIPAHTSGCENCGYDLTSLASKLCPECGTPIEKPPVHDPS